MPPQIEMTLPLEQHENIEQSLPDQKQNETKLRQHLLILLLIQWIVFIVTLGVGIYSVSVGNAADTSSGVQSLIPIVVLSIFYTFGLLVTYKKDRIGLLVFASIGVTLFIAASIFLGYLTLAVVGLSVGFGGTTDRLYLFLLFMGIFYTVAAIVVIASLKFSFKLAKLIKLNDYALV